MQCTQAHGVHWSYHMVHPSLRSSWLDNMVERPVDRMHGSGCQGRGESGSFTITPNYQPEDFFPCYLPDLGLHWKLEAERIPWPVCLVLLNQQAEEAVSVLARMVDPGIKRKLACCHPMGARSTLFGGPEPPQYL